MFFCFFPRWHHCCACGDIALHSASGGDCVLREWTKNGLNLLHSFLQSCKSPASWEGGGGLWWWGIEMCLCLWRSRGRVLGEGIKSIVLPPCPPQATEDLIWQLQGGTWKDQNRDQSPPFFDPLPFCGGREKESVSSHCGGWVWLFVSEGGGGRRAGSVNAYHDHNRANKHSSAMKAQRERLRIPGLTLEWVFSSVTLRAGAPLQCVASTVSVSYLLLSFAGVLSPVQR